MIYVRYSQSPKQNKIGEKRVSDCLRIIDLGTKKWLFGINSILKLTKYDNTRKSKHQILHHLLDTLVCQSTITAILYLLQGMYFPPFHNIEISLMKICRKCQSKYPPDIQITYVQRRYYIDVSRATIIIIKPLTVFLSYSFLACV